MNKFLSFVLSLAALAITGNAVASQKGGRMMSSVQEESGAALDKAHELITNIANKAKEEANSRVAEAELEAKHAQQAAQEALHNLQVVKQETAQALSRLSGVSTAAKTQFDALARTTKAITVPLNQRP